jgi:hypothetical protein
MFPLSLSTLSRQIIVVMKENRSMLIPKLVKDEENKLHWMGL